MRRISSTHAISLHLFGSVELHGAPEADALLAQEKRWAVFLFLLLATPRGFHRRDRIVNYFWPEMSDSQARAALRKALHAIRQGLGEEMLISRGDEEVSVAHDRVWCDVQAFDEARTSGRHAEMLELHSGDLLNGFFVKDAPEFVDWLDGERRRLRGEASNAAWALADQYEKGSDLTAAARWARKAARFAGEDERRIRRVLQLLDRAGDRAGALDVYESFASALKKQHDAEPSPETREVARGIRERA
jgi:DNA-binding SARP family transcriptional activator